MAQTNYSVAVRKFVTHNAMRPVPPSGKMPENSPLSPKYYPGSDLNLGRKPAKPKPLPPLQKGKSGYGPPSIPIPLAPQKGKPKPRARLLPGSLPRHRYGTTGTVNA